MTSDLYFQGFDPFVNLDNPDNGVVRKFYDELIKRADDITRRFTGIQLRKSIDSAVENFLPLECERTVRRERNTRVPKLNAYLLPRLIHFNPETNNYQFTQEGLDDLRRRGIDTYVFPGD